jgi:cytosine/adenosine deaminase-related metal-dependent hydrolase
MCILCNEGRSQSLFASRRNFLKGAAAAGVAAAGFNLFSARSASATGGGDPPRDTGRPGRRYLIRGGSVMSMDPTVPDLVRGDVLVEGKRILAIGPNLHSGNVDVIDARGRIVMPGFIDTHHHQAWTAIRSSIPDSILIDDGTGTPGAQQNYFANILAGPAGTSGFARHYRPQDVYISELVGGLSQLDNGVTTAHDISQIHHSPQHSDAAVKGLIDAGRRGVLGYFESAGNVAGNQYPTDATRIKQQWFSSADQLTSMTMGGEVYLGLPTYSQSWAIGRQLGLQIAAHILSPFGIRSILDSLAVRPANDPLSIRSDNLFIHMTGMSDLSWNKVKQVGAQVSIAFPIEMNMRHGIPPILKMQELGIEPSLSSDVETNMTACFFTQMRSAMTMQRMVVNQKILEQGDFITTVWPSPAPGTPPLLNVRDVLRYATINGAKHLRLDGKTGSLKPGKEADIIILDGTHINVTPVNHVPGAVVQMMDRSNVETVIVAGKVRKWRGKLLGVDLPRLREQLDDSRDYLFAKAGVTKNVFR